MKVVTYRQFQWTQRFHLALAFVVLMHLTIVVGLVIGSYIGPAQEDKPCSAPADYGEHKRGIATLYAYQRPGLFAQFLGAQKGWRKSCSASVVGLDRGRGLALIMTNNHCLQPRMQVYLYNADRYHNVLLVHRSFPNDVAFLLIKVAGENLQRIKAYPVVDYDVPAGTNGHLCSGYWDDCIPFTVLDYREDGALIHDKHFEPGDSGSPLLVDDKIVGVHYAHYDGNGLSKPGTKIWPEFARAKSIVKDRFGSTLDSGPPSLIRKTVRKTVTLLRQPFRPEPTFTPTPVVPPSRPQVIFIQNTIPIPPVTPVNPPPDTSRIPKGLALLASALGAGFLVNRSMTDEDDDG